MTKGPGPIEDVIRNIISIFQKNFSYFLGNTKKYAFAHMS